MQNIAQNSLLILSLFLVAGGIAGYAKAKSKISLITGIVSAILLAGTYAWSLTDYKTGLLSGLAVISALDITFCVRLAKTKKFMPAGLLLVICLITQLCIVLNLGKMA